MNIIVKPYGSQMTYCRPDTTWERENRDLYSPDYIRSWFWTPVIFVRISKAGKCISQKFAGRYYDAFNFGVLLYSGTDIAFSSCLDHTSILPHPLYNPVAMENKEMVFNVFKDQREIFNSSRCEINIELLEEAISKASKFTSLRIGDMIAVELAPISILADSSEHQISIKGTLFDNILFDSKIIF